MVELHPVSRLDGSSVARTVLLLLQFYLKGFYVNGISVF